MRARSFVVPFAFAVLIALTGVVDFDPVSPGVFAQGNPAAAAQGGRGRGGAPPGTQAPGGGGGTRCAAGDPGPAGGRRAAGRGHVHLEELLQGQGEVAGQALLPLQRAAPALRDVERAAASAPIRPTSASWGDCNADWPREQHPEPYPYKTAKEHYEALMAAAKAKGGPTVYTKATMPDWDGYYQRDAQADHGSEWIWGVTQAPTVLSVLTPEYQKRMVQMIYHEAVTNAPQWNASFCYPEGFIRWWSQPSQAGNFQLTMTTWQVQFLSGIADNFLRQVMIGKRARAEGAAVVRGDGRILGRHDAGHLDGEHSGLDADARDVRDQRQAGDRGNVQARARRRRQVHRPRSRDDLLRSGGVRRSAPRLVPLRAASRRRTIRIAATPSSSA